MTRTYLILKTTDAIHRAIDNQSLNNAHQALVELHDDIQEYKVDDKAYEEVVEDTETLLGELTSRKRASMEGLPDNIASQLADLSQRIESLYLRNSGNETTGGESTEQLREERDFYREKLREYEQEIQDLKDHIHEKQLEMTERRAKFEQKTTDMQERANDLSQRVEDAREDLIGTEDDEN